MAGVDYQRNASRGLYLDHYDSNEYSVYGPFEKTTSNNVTLGGIAPYIALQCLCRLQLAQRHSVVCSRASYIFTKHCLWLRRGLLHQ